MTLPNVKIEIQDPGLGLIPATAVGYNAVIGAASTGTDNQVNTFTDPAQAAAIYTEGPLLDLIRMKFAEGAAKIYGIKATDEDDGAAGSVTDDPENTGTGVLTVKVGSKPRNNYEVVVEIIEPGANADATFKYSLDGGDTWSAETAVPSPSPGDYLMPNTGVTITFTEGGTPADSWDAGDKFTFDCTAPTVTNANIIAAIDALIAANKIFELIFVAGNSVSATWTALGTKADSLEAAFVYTRIICQAAGPTAVQDTDTWVGSLETEALAFEHTRVGVVAGRAEVVIPGSQRQADVNASGLIGGRLASIPVQRSAGKVADGSLSSALALLPSDINDGHIDDLDAARYSTLRTFKGRPGIYITNARLMAGPTSDYRYVETARVMDKACRLVYQAGLELVQSEFAGDEDSLEAARAQLEVPLNRMTGRSEIVAGEVIIPPGQDVIGTGTLLIKVRIIPIGIIRWLEVEIGLVNPAVS